MSLLLILILLFFFLFLLVIAVAVPVPVAAAVAVAVVVAWVVVIVMVIIMVVVVFGKELPGLGHEAKVTFSDPQRRGKDGSLVGTLRRASSNLSQEPAFQL